MAKRARVNSIDELRRFRVGICEFIDDCRTALMLIRSDISRTQSWVEREQLLYWEGMVKRRTKELSQARNDLNRKELTSDRTLDERRAVERAKRQLEEARQKVRVVQKWVKMLPNELDRLIGSVQHLSHSIDRDGPQAVSSLDEILKSLESYLALQAPSIEPKRSASTEPEEVEIHTESEGETPIGGSEEIES